MRKGLCLLLGIAMIGSMVLTAGCGDNGIGTILAAAIMITIVASTAGTGGAGVAPFMASTRERPAIIGAARTLKVTTDKLKFRVTPYSNGVAAGDPVLTSEITTNNTIQASGSIEFSNVTTDYLVELVQGDTNKPLMQSFKYTVSNGDIVAVNPDTTAESLVYAKWVERNPTNKSVENFKQNLALNPTADDALATTIYDLINNDTTVANLADVNLASTTLTTAAQTAAGNIATESRIVPTTLANYNGLWLCQNGALPVNLVQNGDAITGMVNGITPLTGTVSGKQATLTMSPGDRTEVWTLTMNDLNTSFSGTWVSTPTTGAPTSGSITGIKH